ncbi:MAG: hypothetical protein RLZZ58_1992 [Pseudomonadota bacterium]
MLAARIAERAVGGEVRLTTRNRPKQADALIGGRLYFIIRHAMVACVEILRFEDSEDGRVDIVCADALMRVAATPKRAHQGWRYLKSEDAPRLLGNDEVDDALPPDLARALGDLSLL